MPSGVINDVRTWLEGLGLADYAGAFEANRIDADVLLHLTEQDLTELGLPIGPRRKILVAIRGLTETPAAEQPGPVGAGTPSRDPERRQITVMFCDLVGSTALSEALDAEDLRDLMQAYQQVSGAAIERYAGHVAQYLGDGLMTYFGWPSAHEDDAQRAVMAGLEIIEAVKALEACRASARAHRHRLRFRRGRRHRRRRCLRAQARGRRDAQPRSALAGACGSRRDRDRRRDAAADRRDVRARRAGCTCAQGICRPGGRMADHRHRSDRGAVRGNARRPSHAVCWPRRRAGLPARALGPGLRRRRAGRPGSR